MTNRSMVPATSEQARVDADAILWSELDSARCQLDEGVRYFAAMRNPVRGSTVVRTSGQGEDGMVDKVGHQGLETRSKTVW